MVPPSDASPQDDGAGAVSSADSGSGEDPPASFLLLANVLLRHRRAVTALVLIGVLVLVVGSLLVPATYTSTVRFTPQAGGTEGDGVSGLARRFGLDVASGTPGSSPAFYAALVETRELMERTVQSGFTPSAGSGDDGEDDLVERLEVAGPDSAARVDCAIRLLRERLSVETDRATGMVSVAVSTRDPELSRQIAARIVELVNRFNLRTRQSRAAEERRFLADRLEAARRDLVAAEDSLRRFLEDNRRFENSPRLVFEHDRLRRRVELQQQVYTSLASRFEEAKIDEVRDTPVITVVDGAERPARPDPRRLVLKGVIGLMAGGLLGVVWSFSVEFFRGAPAREPEEYREFVRLLDRTRDDLRSGWRKLPRGKE